jgi:hypothetical protein
MKTKTLQILNLLGFGLVILLNTLANALPLNGYTTGALSDRYPNLFVPAGFTFSIWGVIYLLLLLFVVYQLRDWWQRPRPGMAFVQQIGPWFFVSCLANASWILAWHFLQVPLSLVIMLLILGSLLLIYLRLGIGESAVANNNERWLVRLPFSVYLGWITVATIANVTTILVDYGWRGGPLSEVAWTAIMIATATLIGLLVLYRRSDVGYALVLIWAFYGIYTKQSANTVQDVQLILTGLLVGMGLLGVGALLRVKRWLS